MRSLTMTVLFCALAAAAPAADKKHNDKPVAQTTAIPKDAVANPDGTYSYTDKQGKKWTFIKTPFGLMKRPVTETTAATPWNPGAKPAAAAPVVENRLAGPGTTTATDKGDTVRFERASPFGKVTWEKKKSELTEGERQILDAQNAKTGNND